MADPPAMLYHMDVELIYPGRRDLLPQQIGCPIYGCLRLDQSQSSGDSENVGIHRQGWFVQGEEQHTASCLGSDPGQTSQVLFGFGHRLGFQRTKGDTALFLLDLLEHLLDSRCLDLTQPSALDGLSNALWWS